ncbi:hypothetical protein GH714_024444 [Hevea brasiliensis]|uniref:Aminotransferase class V domain-containing protein n=1 Tax=Hevea brasiliensis TaxID=3981 RepID=A0A6A6MH82_HEVBR|nr:hypothetical protein GH714_024444 [Hevea brasiliensis]
MNHMDAYRILEADVAKISIQDSADTNVGPFVHDAIFSIPADAWISNDLAVDWNSQQPLPYKNLISSSDLSYRGVSQGYQGGGMVNGVTSSQGSHNITQTSATPPKKAGGNVHTGGPPPWFEATEENHLSAELKPISSSFISLSNKPGKKLNPKRVGAAWAERRKIELEMEKRGEIVKSDCDDTGFPILIVAILPGAAGKCPLGPFTTTTSHFCSYASGGKFVKASLHAEFGNLPERGAQTGLFLACLSSLQAFFAGLSSRRTVMPPELIEESFRVRGKAGNGVEDVVASLRSLRMEMGDKMKTRKGMTYFPVIFVVFFLREICGQQADRYMLQAMVEGQHQKSLFASVAKPPTDSGRPSSMVVKKAHTLIPAYVVAEAISTIQGLDLRWSGPITPSEMQYVEQYVLAKYPQYAGLLVGEKIDLSTLCINEEASEAAPDDKKKSPRSSFREVSSPSLGGNLPDLEIQAQNKVLKHCGLPDDEYLVLFTPNYKDAMMLVGESYPFFRGNFYMSTIAEEMDYIREFATYKESKMILAPETWLDLRIKGSQLSQYFRRKNKHSPKGLFSYPADVNGTRYSMHWVSEAHRNSWHVLLDATALVMGKDSMNLALHRPDFVLGSPDNAQANPSNITCLLVRKKSFDNSTTSS